MKRSYKWLVCWFALVAAGCGGRGMSAYQASAPPQSAYASSAPAEAAAKGDASPSSAPAPGDYRAEQEARPGLATMWGEDRTSRVTEVSFVRRNPTQPFAAVSFYYNDRAGVSAMAAQSGRSDWYDNVVPVAANRLSVRLLDERGLPLPSARAGGRSYVMGEYGQRYLIQIQNQTGNRVEVLATVDGLDVIDGRPGSYQKNGYVVAPFATIQIDGFRRSSDTVAAFRFGTVSESYAEKKGEGRNVGVIGVAFFDEAGSTWPWTDDEIRRRHDADPFPGRYAQPPTY
jgi:hypothetical protein